MAELQALEDWCADMLAKLQPAARRRMLVDVARALRARNAERMKAQTDPDGQAWAKRKPQGDPAKVRSKRQRERLRDKARRPMFEKLRRAKWLKAQAKGGSAVVQFAGRAARIAAVHHYGETDEVNPGRGPAYEYPARELLGISPADAELIRDIILRHLHP